MQLGNSAITFEENDERIKISYPLKRSHLAIGVYTILITVWGIALILFVYGLFTKPLGFEEIPDEFRLLWRIIWMLGVLAWLFVWIRVIGRMLLRWWQFYLAEREILFIYPGKHLLICRPVAIWGLTDGFDLNHVSPFYHHPQHHSLAFKYGKVTHTLFALTVPEKEQKLLLDFLNRTIFPYYSEEDDE